MTYRKLTCCICGEDAGRWQQHWNRDTGWGVCRACVERESAANSAQDMIDLYGQEGINYAPPARFSGYRPLRADEPLDTPGLLVVTLNGELDLDHRDRDRHTMPGSIG